jgi:hypothetical protein
MMIRASEPPMKERRSASFTFVFSHIAFSVVLNTVSIEERQLIRPP